MRKHLLFLALFFSQSAICQLQVGPFVGASGYLGDLNYKPLKRIKPAIGVSGLYEISSRVNVRLGVALGTVEGGDQWSGTTFQQQNRNLSFRSSLTEASLVAELNIFNLEKINWSPYLFGGIAFFHFNPYVRDSGTKVFLKPLSTEGQGLAEYPDRKPYSLNQFSVPLGGGLRFVLNDNTMLSLELGLRRTSTDYLDDVSTTYVDETILRQQRGEQAVRFSYRGDEVPGEASEYPDNGYAQKGAVRGTAARNDWYYFTGVHLFFRLGNSYSKNGRGGKSYGCPTVRL